MKIVIVGSGLAALSAARALVNRGIKPVLWDVGRAEDEEKAFLVKEMALQKPDEWAALSKSRLFVNSTVTGKTIPRKLAFGSDYFYGASTAFAKVEHDGSIPPFSYATGGFSVGWGASVLPPDDSDIGDWPIKTSDLAPYYIQVLSQLPYSAGEDGLSKKFPLYSQCAAPLELAAGNKQLMDDLKAGSGSYLFGQARLLTRAHTENGLSGCQYCGQCMSGCVYDSIYKSSQTLDALLRQNKIEYKRGIFVDSLRERDGRVEVSVLEAGANPATYTFDRVVIAAGAVNSTRIMLKSKSLYGQNIPLLATNGFVVPMLRLRRLKGGWPNINTQPAIFLEYKADQLSNHWIHSQLSIPNDLVYALFGVRENKKDLTSRLKRRMLEHIVIANCNLHSDHSNRYSLALKKEGGHTVLHSTLQALATTAKAHKVAKDKLATIGRMLGWYMLKSKAQHSFKGGGFHVGGTMPMRFHPESELDTDLLGCPKGLTRVHIVDSSILPSLPGTTIGLVAMANAYRIATQLDLV